MGKETEAGSKRSAVVPIIVVVAVVAAVIGGVAIARRGGSGQEDAGFPEPSPVPSESHDLRSIGRGKVRGWKLPVALSGPRDVLVEDDGAVWVTEQNRGAVGRFTDGTFVRYRMDEFPDDSGAFSLARTSDGAIWFSGYPQGTIGRILSGGDANMFASLGSGSTTIGIAPGPDGSVWVSDVARSVLIRIGSDGAVDFISLPPRGNDLPAPRDLVAAADGTVWFADPGTDSVGTVTWREGDPQVRVLPLAAGSDPRAITAAPDGSLWVTLGSSRRIARIDPAAPGSGDDDPSAAPGSAEIIAVPSATGKLNGIAVASDGTLWITEQGPFVLHVRPDGSTIERFELPGGASYADGIALASDGTVWVAATDANLLVSITP